ncbi:MAG: 4Fe-4S binding protein [Dehalococcoidia bacterium]|nr:4Fe-4S binding protein [Dehalococcoidia bacterium]
MPGIDIDAPGSVQLLLGNEAIARGALEAGIGFAAAYPGTPSSEILETLARVAKKMNFHAEWSTNEMVAMEAAAGASFAGIPAISSMKQNGADVVSDFLVNVGMTGVGKGGLVAVIGDDPSAISSSNEQDSRWICKWMDMPLLEPSSAQEAKDMVKWAFELSRELDIVVVVRETTRLAHTRSNVKLGELVKTEKEAYFSDTWDMFQPAKSQFAAGPFGILHYQLQQRLAKAPAIFETSPFNYYVGPDKPELLIITSGVCWLYSTEAVERLGLQDRVGIFKLGTSWPLPEKLVEKQLGRTNEVLFVEEINPFIEGSVMELAASFPANKPHINFYGKRTGHVNLFGELNTDLVTDAVAKVVGITYQARDAKYDMELKEAAKMVPPRSINFCPGCPHRATYWAIKNALTLDGRNGVVAGDIGCYSMGFAAGGFFQERAMHCMGGGIGVANGLGNLKEFGFDQPVIAVAGDSTFYHACIPALINGVWNRANFIFLILDNSATAMTGFQPHPGVGVDATGEQAPAIDMEALCRSMGIKVEVCDPFDLKNTTETLVRLMADDEPGAKVVIMRRICELVRGRREKHAPYKMHVDPDKCVGDECGCNRLCIRLFACPGLMWDNKAGKAKIDEAQCTGCGVCSDICSQGAIIKEAA